MLAIEDLMYICILEKFQVWQGGSLQHWRQKRMQQKLLQQVASSWTCCIGRQCCAACCVCGSVAALHVPLLAYRLPWAAMASLLTSALLPATAVQEIGVDMLPRVEPVEESTATLKALTGAPAGWESDCCMLAFLSLFNAEACLLPAAMQVA